MNKLYSLLISAAVCSAATGLVGSEKSENLFFDESTQEVLKDTALFYGISYAFLYSYATVGSIGCCLIDTALDSIDTVIGRCSAKKYRHNFSVIQSLKEIPGTVFLLNKEVTRTHKVAAPLAIGYVAYNKYEQYKSYK